MRWEEPQKRGWGLYAHIPFCARRCPYCDFTVAVLSEPPFSPYMRALADEIRTRAQGLEGPPDTIYFGGGTPGMLPPEVVDSFADLMEALRINQRCEEFTVEFNPEHASPERLRAWRALGADRISLGVQSIDASALRFLGREHARKEVFEAVERALRAGFETISVDLIFGLPGHEDAAIQSARELLSIPEIQHVSCYELTIEEGTLFGAKRRRGELTARPDDSTAEEWARLRDALQSMGFSRYEVSNYARNGRIARHNSAYWTGRPYLGVGVGAHSLLPGVALEDPWFRVANAPQLAGYLQAHREGRSTPCAVDILGRREQLEERVITGLRTVFGLDINELERCAGRELAFVRETMERFVWEGLGVYERNRYLPSSESLDLADASALRTLRALDEDLA